MEDSPTSEWARLSCSCVLACWEGNSFYRIGIITNTFQPMIWNSLPTRVVGVWLPVGLSGDHWVGLAPEPKLHCAPRKERLLGFVNTQISHATLGSGASWSYSTIIGLHKICPQQVYFSLNATFCCRATKWFFRKNPPTPTQIVYLWLNWIDEIPPCLWKLTQDITSPIEKRPSRGKILIPIK